MTVEKIAVIVVGVRPSAAVKAEARMAMEQACADRGYVLRSEPGFARRENVEIADSTFRGFVYEATASPA